MEPQEINSLVQRLVANPADEDALARAYHHGSADPQSYAELLERVGRETPDTAYACHWLTEAANVWASTVGDVHRAVRALLDAVLKDPSQDAPAERLAQIYRDKGEMKGLATLLEKRAKLLVPMAASKPELIAKAAAIHEELGTLWAEAPLSQPKRAVEHFKRAWELDPQNAFAIYSARELLKQMESWSETVPLFAAEQALATDPDRKVALYRDEAQVRKNMGDVSGSSISLRQALAVTPDDVALIQEYASSVLERVQAGQSAIEGERADAAEQFVRLAEMYDGEHGYSYACAALELEPGQDRGVQLATHYGAPLGRGNDLVPVWAEYLAANPQGAMVPQIRRDLVNALEADGNLVEAIAVLEKCHDDPELVAKLAELRAGAGDVPSLLGPDSVPELPPIAALDLEPSVGRTPLPGHHAPAMASATAQSHAISTDSLAHLLEVAGMHASKRQMKEALAKYMEVLKIDPVSPEALAWVDEYLRSRRQHAELRDVYHAATRAPNLGQDQRKKYLLNVANICEQQLRDFDGAIQALKQLSQIDSSAREGLRRLLEKGQRWDDLAVLLDQEASEAPDQEIQLMLLKKLAALQEQKRRDPIAAGEAWARMAGLLSGDEAPLLAAIKLFEKGGRLDLAAQVIGDNYSAIDTPDIRMTLVSRLGDLREKCEDFAGAGDAFAEAAELGAGVKSWLAAQRCYERAQRWDEAAHAIGELAVFAKDAREQASMRSKQADLLLKAGDAPAAITALEQAADLDILNEKYAEALEKHYQESERVDDLVAFIERRAAAITDVAKRVALRKQAALIRRDQLQDIDGARDAWLRVLEDGDDIEVLSLLSGEAHDRGDAEQETSLLHRLAAATTDPAAKIAIIVREAEAQSESLNDLDAAVNCYESVLAIDHNNREALSAIAALEQRRDNVAGLVAALERLLAISTEKHDKIELAGQLAKLYEQDLQDLVRAIGALEVVYAADPDDLDAVARMVELCERTERWERVVELTAILREMEGDPEESSFLARRMAEIMSDKLSRGKDALAIIEGLADEGDEACREAYVELGDKLGLKGVVAAKLRDWYALATGPKRQEAISGAFERFLEVGQDADAAQVAVELIRSRSADEHVVQRLEEIAVRLKDLDSLNAAHDVMVRELAGLDRATEFVRQAEMQVKAGVDALEAVNHGEHGLASVSLVEVEPLLERLSALLPAPGHAVDLYERQVSRCKNPADRLTALARASQVAVAKGAPERAQAFFEIALGGGVKEETVELLAKTAAEGDAQTGTTVLRETLAKALASGSQGLRDGGRTRSALLRRAAMMALHDLNDSDRALKWLGEALVTHVEVATLDSLEDIGEHLGDFQKVDDLIGKALEEVFDGPLVRQLRSRRAKIRRERLGNLAAAAEDLRKLHEIAPSDAAVTDELYGLLKELKDYRGMVQLLEDQILRGKDPAARAELARSAARLWEERLSDAREAADAWRRVLRMKPGDTEAQSGLDRAKSNMLKPVTEEQLVDSAEQPAVQPAPVVEPENKPAIEPEPESPVAPVSEPKPEPELVAEADDISDTPTPTPVASVPPPLPSPALPDLIADSTPVPTDASGESPLAMMDGSAGGGVHDKDDLSLSASAVDGLAEVRGDAEATELDNLDANVQEFEPDDLIETIDDDMISVEDEAEEPGSAKAPVQ